jgi:hypothetical protein
MTAPLTRPPSRLTVIILIGLVAVTAAMPFARREDWLGWMALVTIGAVALGLWMLLLWGFARAILQRWRSQSGSE